MEALLTTLTPDVTLEADRCILPSEAPAWVQGAATVAERAVLGAMPWADVVLVEDRTGVAALQSGRLSRVLAFTVADGLITRSACLPTQDASGAWLWRCPKTDWAVRASPCETP